MNKYKPILQDGFILLVVATAFVTVCNEGFKALKKGAGNTDPLVTAMNQGKLATLEELLGEKGMASAANKAEFATLAEFQKARANRQDDFGRTPLMWAAYANFSDSTTVAETDAKRVALVEFLATHGADLNAKDKEGWTPLMWASWSGLTQVATKLVELGATPAEADDQGNTALMIASLRANAEIVKLLADKGADKTVAARNGMKAIDFAQDGLKKYPSRAQGYQAILQVL